MPSKRGRGDVWARLLLGVLGAGLIVYPLVALDGWATVAAIPLVVLGVLLVVLCAFYWRIDGAINFRGVQIPIAPWSPSPESQPPSSEVTQDVKDESEPDGFQGANRGSLARLFRYVPRLLRRLRQH